MEVNEFFDMFENMVRDTFDHNGKWLDAAFSWNGEDRELAMVRLEGDDAEAVETVKTMVELSGHVAYGVAYEAGPADDAAAATIKEDPTIPDRTLFLFMACEDGQSRTRVYAIAEDGERRVGSRMPALEAHISPFDGIFGSPALKH